MKAWSGNAATASPGTFGIGLEYLSAPFSVDAKPLSNGAATGGSITGSLDLDQYTFAATGTSAKFVTSGTLTSNYSFVATFAVYDAQGRLKAHWSTNAGTTTTVAGLSANATYVLVVNDAAYASTGRYSVTVQSVRPVSGLPTVASLVTSAATVRRGGTVTLTAASVADAFNDVTSVVFYRESDGVAGLQAGSGGDVIVSTDASTSGGYTAAFSTAALAAGTYTFYAEAFAANGAVSGVVSVREVVT